MKTKTITLLFACASLVLSACGGASTSTTSTAANSSSGDSYGQPAPLPALTAEVTPNADWEVRTPRPDNPELTVRVDGPDPVPVTEDVQAPWGLFETELVVTNDGDEAARIEQAYVSFDVWSEDGERTRCTPIAPLGTEPLVEPGEAETLRARSKCSFPGPGEYEVRTYVSFDADAIDGSLEVERHYAGRREVTVR